VENLCIFFASGDEDEKELLIDVNDLYENDVTYLRENQWDELTTLNVWKDVNEAIVRNDMKTADIEKIKVESEQRKRIALKREEGLMDESEHFEKNTKNDRWIFRDNINLSHFIEETTSNNQSRKKKKKKK